MVERDAAHRTAAELLLQAGALPESAAGHLLRVTPRADQFVVSTLRQAAARSLAQGAAEAAVGYLARALEEQLDPAARAEVLVELGLAERRTNGPAAVNHLRAGLELLADPGRRGQVSLELGRALWFTDRIADALAVFQRALDEVDREHDPDLYELLVAASAWWNPRTYPIAEAAIGELDLDALHGGLGSEILLATIAHYEYRLGQHRQLTIGLARRSLASGNLLASSPIAFLYAVVTLFRSGVLDGVVPAFNQAIAQARRRGDIFNVAFLLMSRGACQTDRGDLRAAVADLREAIELSVAHGGLLSLVVQHWVLGVCAARAGRCGRGGASHRPGRLLGAARARPGPPGLVSAPPRPCAHQRPEAPSGESRSSSESARPFGCSRSTIQAAAPWRSWAAEGLRLLDRNDEARALAAEELALARHWGDPHAIGACLRVLGLVEGGTAGIGLLREAVEVLAGTEARLKNGHALVDLGAALRRANQRTEARRRLRQGVDLAQRLGAFRLARRQNEEIAATGARPRKVLQTGLDALTASERRVAQLAADGMSNKEIAQTLFVTIKTVEVHLSHAYRKLEISSRAQLDDALGLRHRARRLLPPSPPPPLRRAAEEQHSWEGWGSEQPAPRRADPPIRRP